MSQRNTEHLHSVRTLILGSLATMSAFEPQIPQSLDFIRPGNRRYRHITIFTQPLGTPSPGGESHVTNNSSLWPQWGRHWGILLQDPYDTQGQYYTYFELYRPDGGVDVLVRSKAKREEQEGRRKLEIFYADTGCFTSWTNPEIRNLARNLCIATMNGKYGLINANCQTLTNLLITRIKAGPDVFTPAPTASHRFNFFKAGLNPKRLSKAHAADKLPANNSLEFKKELQSPNWAASKTLPPIGENKLVPEKVDASTTDSTTRTGQPAVDISELTRIALFEARGWVPIYDDDPERPTLQEDALYNAFGFRTDEQGNIVPPATAQKSTTGKKTSSSGAGFASSTGST